MIRCTRVLLATLLLLTGAAGSQASPFLISKATVYLSGGGQILIGDQQNGDLISFDRDVEVNFANTGAPVNGGVHASAAAYAEFGRLGASAAAESQLSLYNGALQLIAKGESEAIMGDVFVLSGLTSGLLRFHFAVTGGGPDTSLVQTNIGSSMAEAAVTLTARETGAARVLLMPGDATFDVPVTAGLNDISFSFAVTTTCITGAGASCTAFANYLHTATVTGVELLDSTGALASSGGFSAQSGHDYSGSPVPVPEPASLFLTGAGLIVASRAARKRLKLVRR